MPTNLQRYQLRLTYESDGHWHVTGHWEVTMYNHSPQGRRIWDLDGAPMGFKTRKDALEFLMNQQGIPE